MMKPKEPTRPVTVYLKEKEYAYVEQAAYNNESNLSTELRRAVRRLMQQEALF